MSPESNTDSRDTISYPVDEDEQGLTPQIYELRAHHLNKLMHFMLAGVDQATAELISASQKEENGPLSGPAYVADIFGTSDSEREHVTSLHHTIFNTFNELPDDAAVSLTRVPDAICKACVLGRHCLLSQPDWLVMEEYMRCANRIKRQSNEQTGEPYVRKMDEQGRLEAVLTTKKNVAEVIAYILEPVKRSLS